MDLDFQQLFESSPGNYLVLDPTLQILAMSNAYLRITNTERQQLLKKFVFDVFPDNPADPGATGVANLKASFERVLKSKEPDTIPVQKYDIPRFKGEAFEERYWSLCTTPVLDEQKKVNYLILQVDDVTETILLQNQEAKTKAFNEQLKRENEERKQTEEALRISEKKFRLLVEELPIGVWLLDEQGKVDYGNKSAIKIWGGAKFVGPIEYTQFKAWWLDSGKKVEMHEWATVKALKSGKKVIGDEVMIQKFNGEYAKIINSAFPLVDNQKKIIGVLVTNQDVTEEKQLEQDRMELMKKLEEEKLLLEAVIETAPVGILLMKGDQAIPNQQLKKMFGAGVDWSKGQQAILGIVSEPDSCNAVEFDKLTTTKAINGETTTGQEEVLCFPNGSQVPVLSNSGPIRNGTGEIIGAVTIFQDISELKQIVHEREDVLRKLDKEKRWLQALFEDAPITILMIRAEDPEHPIPNKYANKMKKAGIDWNRGQESYLGRVFDAKGRTLQKDELPSMRILHGETLVTEEYLIKFSNGRETPFIVSGGVIDDENGQRLGAVLFYQDISPLKEAERFREEWSAVIAHDLRQPITTIRLAADLMKSSSEEDETIRNLTAMIESSANQINRMTHDLLEVSQLEAHKLRLELQETSIATLLGEIVHKYQQLVPEKPIKFNISGKLPKIKVDQDRFEQIIGNLISNAAKYSTPETEILIRASKTTDAVRISIMNKGMGIEPEDMEHLFQRFHRSSRAKKKGIKGVGLGLYITKGLVEAHGGEIFATSEPGKTTTFCIELPAKKEQAMRNG